MIFSRNRHSLYTYTANSNSEFYEYPDDFEYECVVDALVSEDWEAPTHRNKFIVRSEVTRRRESRR